MAEKIATQYEAHAKNGYGSTNTGNVSLTQLCSRENAMALGCIIEAQYLYKTRRLVPLQSIIDPSSAHYKLTIKYNVTDSGYTQCEIDAFYFALFNANPNGNSLPYANSAVISFSMFGVNGYLTIDYNWGSSIGLLVNTVPNPGPNITPTTRVTPYSSQLYPCYQYRLGTTYSNWKAITTNYFYLESRDMTLEFNVKK